MKTGISLALAFFLGFGCSLFGLQAPSPNSLFGAGMVVAVTVGYICGEYV